jgi:hydroxymethylpyrimidine/phosphomethylpyrimidine kinase
VFPVPAAFVAEQIEAVLADLPVAGTKTGMLATPDIVRTVAELAAAGRLPNLVVDPVMVASSGDRLLQEEAEQLYVTALIPHARVITPNIREAEVLLGQPIRDLAAQHEAARALGALGPAAVVVKGGHAVAGTERVAVDVVWSGGATYELRSARVSTRNNHGTGCTFAAATAANLARGADIRDALEDAKAYITRAVAGGSAWRLGSGHGPVDHFSWSSPQAAASSAGTGSAP